MIGRAERERERIRILVTVLMMSKSLASDLSRLDRDCKSWDEIKEGRVRRVEVMRGAELLIVRVSCEVMRLRCE